MKQAEESRLWEIRLKKLKKHNTNSTLRILQTNKSFSKMNKSCHRSFLAKYIYSRFFLSFILSFLLDYLYQHLNLTQFTLTILNITEVAFYYQTTNVSVLIKYLFKFELSYTGFYRSSFLFNNISNEFWFLILLNSRNPDKK